MASLIEDLISILEQENEAYNQLIPIAERKTQVIVNEDLLILQSITNEEQLFLTKIGGLEKKREEAIVNIGTVISKSPSSLNIASIIKILEKQPEEQKQLSIIHDNLKKTIQRLVEINNHNKSLIEQSLEMIEFNMNFIQSTRMSPGNNNYTKGAESFDAPVLGTGMFDKRQ